MIFHIVLIILGFILLVKGAEFLVEGSSNIGKKFHIPEVVIGLTIVSIGTSMPELIVSLKAAFSGYADLAIGNVIGSNIANLFLILGMCALIKSLEFDDKVTLFDSFITVICTLIFFIMCNNSKNTFITKQEGAILLVCCILYILHNIYISNKSKELNKEIELEENNIIKSYKLILYIIIGIVALKFGGDLVVNNSVEIGRLLGISETLIGLTIVAIGTCLPELITSLIATVKNETDIAIGNILGSQIFNILLIIGMSAFISPIKYAVSYNFDFIILIVGSILLTFFPFFGKKKYMGRIQGAFFLTIYIMYFCSIVCIK